MLFSVNSKIILMIPLISSPSRVINNNVFDITKKKSKHYYSLLKGLGHAILGNYSTDQIVIELT